MKHYCLEIFFIIVLFLHNLISIWIQPNSSIREVGFFLIFGYNEWVLIILVIEEPFFIVEILDFVKIVGH